MKPQRQPLMTQLNIQNLPPKEKVALMEQLWNSLCSTSDPASMIPSWHEDVLERRLHDFEQGKEQLLEWNEVKEELETFIRNS